MWFADGVVHPMSLHLLTVVKPKLCKCRAMAVTGTAWALEAVSKQKLIAANVGMCQITDWFYFLVCCFVKIILQGLSWHVERGLPIVLEASLWGCGKYSAHEVHSLLQTCDRWKSNAESVIYNTPFLSELNRNPFPEAKNSCLLNIWGRICGVKPSG